MSRYDDNYRISLLVPVYNEEETIETFVSEVEKTLEPIMEHIEIVFVDDGSKDKSAQIIKNLMQSKSYINFIALSRNFGKEAAMTAALDLASGDAVVPIDVDLQDPPELILEFVKIWREEGIDTVYGIRTDRSKDTEVKRVTSGGFYFVFNKLSNKVKIPENVGDFRLIDRKVIESVKTLSESNRFMKGLFAWPGFSSKGVAYKRPERVAGTTKWNYWKLWNFALDGIVSFSSLPLRIWSYIGGFIGVLALVYMLYIVLNTLFFGIDVPGYASIMCAVLFLGSVQLISIGILGEYLGRISEETKGRPVYVAKEIAGPLKDTLPQGFVKTRCGIYVNEKSEDGADNASKDK